MNAPAKQPNYRVPALEKALDVFEQLASTEKPQTLADLARSLDRTSRELFRMVSALENRGYLIRDPISGAYRLSLKLYELSHMHSPVDALVRAARVPMRELSDAIRESVHLSVLRQQFVVVVSEEESAERVRLSVEVGSTAAVVLTVSGQLLLAHLAESEREYFLKRDPVYAKWPAAKRKRFLSDFEQIRSDGFCIAPSSYRTGIDIAVIVGNPKIGLAASMSIPFLAGGANHGTERQLVEVMMRTADEINTALRLNTPSQR